MDVFMVWHVRHAKFLDGSPTEHFGEDGELTWDEQDGDSLKLLGVYATRAETEGRIERARQQPGFKDEPDCFMIDTLTLGEDKWTDGFVTIPYE
ncbi:hypothetical protein [Arthrobacter sp. D2-10]